uniref:Family with sequence similarity 237 member B n=1 Tax=Sinocyclocheilus grahami TaxID=75366 RepID=A0A672K8X4_SINGR
MGRSVGFLDGQWWRLLLVCVLMLATAPSYTIIPKLEMLKTEGTGGGKARGQLGEINRECWDASSLAVIQARKLRVADVVAGLWDFMTYLSESNQPKHQDMFMELAQVFWERYVDCVLARAHGLGRRASASRQEIIKLFCGNSIDKMNQCHNSPRQ